MADEIIITMEIRGQPLQSEFTKINSSFALLEESAQRSARTMSREFQAAYGTVGAAGKAALTEAAKLFETRLQSARTSAREEIRLNDEVRRSTQASYDAQLGYLAKLRDGKIKYRQDELNNAKQKAAEELRLVIFTADAAKRAAKDQLDQRLAQARRETDELKRLAAEAAKQGVVLKDYRGSGTADPKEYYRLQSEAARKAYADQVKAAEDAAVRKKAAIDSEVAASLNAFNKMKGQATDQFNQAKAGADAKKRVVDAQLNDELAAIKKKFNEQKGVEEKAARDSIKTVQQVGEAGKQSALAFSTIFGANFLANLATDAFRGLITIFREGVVESILYAARVEELGIALHAVAKANNISAESADAQVDSIKKLNITTEDARGVLTKFAAAQFDVSKANKLAIVSQDLAVVVGRTTAEEFNSLTDAIQTLQTRNLRSAGVFMTVDQVLDRLAKTSGRARNSFTTLEKQQAVLNAVIEYGTRVTGTYEAAMTAASKNIRSTERLVLELKNAFGGLFQGALTFGVIKLNEFLGYLDKNRGVFYLLIGVVIAATVAIIAFASATGVQAVAAVNTLTAALLVEQEAAIASGIATTASFVGAVASGAGLILALGAIVYGIYQYTHATKDLAGANERVVGYLNQANKQIEANITALYAHGTELKTNQTVVDTYRASLQLLNAARRIQIELQGETTDSLEMLTGALRDQQAENEILLKAELGKAFTATLAKIKETNAGYEELVRTSGLFTESLKNVQKAEEAARTAGLSESQILKPPLTMNTTAAMASPLNSKERRDNIAALTEEEYATLRLLEARARLDKWTNENTDIDKAYKKNLADIDQLAAPIAELTRQREKDTGVLYENGRAMLEANGMLGKTEEETILVGDAVERLVTKLRREADAFKGAGGAAAEFLEILDKIKAAALDVEKTPVGAQEYAKETADRIKQMQDDILNNTAPKDHPGGRPLGTLLAEASGMSLEDVQKNQGLIDRYIAASNQSALRQASDLAKSIRGVLGDEGYKQWLETDAGKIISKYSDIAATVIKAGDAGTSAFDGISKSGKVARTEAEKLAEQIKRVEAETRLLAKGGSGDDLDRARLRRAEVLRDMVRQIYETRVELGVDVGKPISTKLDDLQAETRRLERIREVRDAIFDATQAQADAENKLLILRKTIGMETVDVETRAQTKYLEMLQQRREAERDLTAELAVELTKRKHQNELSAESLQTTQAETYLNRVKGEGSALKTLAGSYFNLQMDLGDQTHLDNPLVKSAQEQANKLDSQIKQGDIHITATRRTNEILETNISSRLDQANLNTVASGRAILNALSAINQSIQSAGMMGGDAISNTEKGKLIVKYARLAHASPIDYAGVIDFESGGSTSVTNASGHTGPFQASRDVQRQYNVNASSSFEEWLIAFNKYLADRGYHGGGTGQIYRTVLGGNINAPLTGNPDATGTTPASGVSVIQARQRATMVKYGLTRTGGMPTPTLSAAGDAFTVDNVVKNANKIDSELSKLLDKQNQERTAVEEAQAALIRQLLDNPFLKGNVTARAKALTQVQSQANPAELDVLKNVNEILEHPEIFNVSVSSLVDLGDGVMGMITNVISLAELVRQSELGKVIEAEKTRRNTRHLYGLDTQILQAGFTLDSVTSLGGQGEAYRGKMGSYLDSAAFKGKTDDQQEAIIAYYKSLGDAAAESAKKEEQLAQKTANADLYWFDVRDKARRDFKNNQDELDQKLDAEDAAYEQKRLARLDQNSQYTLNLIRQEVKARRDARDAVVDEIMALERYQATVAGTPQERADIQLGGYRDRLRAATDTGTQIIQMEDKIAHHSEGAADRFRLAWLRAIDARLQADEDAVVRQINAEDKLAHAMDINQAQISAGIYEHLASQKTISEGIVDSFNSFYDAVLKPLDDSIDKMTAKWGIFGNLVNGIFKSIAHQVANIGAQFLMQGLNWVLGGAASPAGQSPEGSLGTGAATGGIGSILGGLFGGGGGSPEQSILEGVTSGVERGVKQIETVTMNVIATNVNVTGGGGIGSALGGGLGGGDFGGSQVMYPGTNIPIPGAGGGGFAGGLFGGNAGFGGSGSGRGGGGATVTYPGTNIPVPGGAGFGGIPSSGSPFGTPGFVPNFGGGGGGPSPFASPALQTLFGNMGGDTPTLTQQTLDAQSGGGLASTNALAQGAASVAPNLGGGMFGGLKGLGAMLPQLGFGLGSSLGGPSGLGQILGGLGGAGLGILGGIGTGAISAGSIFGGVFGAGGSLAIGGLSAAMSATVILAPIAAALLIGAFFIGRSAKRRKEEQQRAQILSDAKSQLNALLKGVQNDSMDGADALTQAQQIRAEYLTQVGQLKDRKTREIAIATVRELDYIITQISSAASVQAVRRSFTDKFVPTYATGGAVGMSTGASGRSLASSNFNIPDMNGYGLISGHYSGRDTFIAALGEGETVLTPGDVSALGGRSVMKRIGVRGYAGGGAVGRVASTVSSAPQSTSNGAPVIQVTAIVVQSRKEAIALANRIPHAIIADKIIENINETGADGLPSRIIDEYTGTYG